ncbi:unnamed protein product [Peniophora sp. CBMAI 1063]|nr:unnamed protein product [Peniophora sp. CBMAI 1063]
MDNHAFEVLLSEGPEAALLEAVGSGQGHAAVAPLLEAELQRSSSRLQRLKEHRNALLSPMYRLHPEILSSIFFNYAQGNGELFNLRWTRLLFVCRRWHDIAMKTLKLWSFIDVSLPQGSNYNSHERDKADARDVRRIETQRSRAGLFPLTLKMSLHNLLSEAKLAYTTLYWSPSSLRSMTVNGEHAYIDKLVHILASHRHPTLFVLALHCFSYGDTSTASTRVEQELDAVLRNNVPQLLHLAYTGLPFNLALVQGLRSLRIAFVGDTIAPASLTLTNLTGALSRCPEIEHLAIHLPSSCLLEGSALPITRPLQHLDLIVVQAATEVCERLLQAVNIPSSTKLIASTNDITDEFPILILASHLGSHALREGAPVVHSIAIVLSRVPVMFEDENGENPTPLTSRLGIFGQVRHRRLDRSTVNRWLYTPEHEESPCIGIESSSSVSAEASIMKNVLQGWPLSQTTCVDVRMAMLTTELLGILISEMPGATTVVMRPESSTAQALLGILHEQVRVHKRRVFTNIIFDAAEVAHTVYPTLDEDEPQRGDVRARRTLMRTLVYCEQAARAGVPLDTIEITNESHESVHRLLARAEDVDWGELCSHLQRGFIYEKVLHSEQPDLDGNGWDSIHC